MFAQQQNHLMTHFPLLWHVTVFPTTPNLGIHTLATQDWMSRKHGMRLAGWLTLSPRIFLSTVGGGKLFLSGRQNLSLKSWTCCSRSQYVDPICGKNLSVIRDNEYHGTGGEELRWSAENECRRAGRSCFWIPPGLSSGPSRVTRTNQASFVLKLVWGGVVSKCFAI